jgi:acetyl esterase
MQQFVENSERYFPDEIISQGIAAQRRAYNAMTASLARKRPTDISVSDQLINDVKTRCYQPKGGKSETTILYAHGGGYYLGGLDSHDSFCADVTSSCQVNIIAVDYRLAPEFPYPVPINDCYAVYQTLVEQGISPILMGDSAGGNLMAALTLLCRKNSIAQATAQILIYPALGLPNSLPSHQTLWDAPLLNYDSLEFCIQNYIPNCYQYSQLELAFPLIASSLEALPPTFIFAAQHDPLIDDAKTYAQRLISDDIMASCTQVNGLVHGGLHAIGVCDEADYLLQLICKKIETLK